MSGARIDDPFDCAQSHGEEDRTMSRQRIALIERKMRARLRVLERDMKEKDKRIRELEKLAKVGIKANDTPVDPL